VFYWIVDIPFLVPFVGYVGTEFVPFPFIVVRFSFTSVIGIGVVVFLVLPVCWIRVRFFLLVCGISTLDIILFGCLIGKPRWISPRTRLTFALRLAKAFALTFRITVVPDCLFKWTRGW